MSADEPPRPDAGRGETPTKRTETIRDDPDERVCVEWFESAPTPPFVTVFVDDDRVIALDTIEVPQAVRALDAVLDGTSDSATVRDLGALERFWFTTSSGFVTLMSEAAGDDGDMVVFTADEARELRAAFETAADELDVEDEPYV